MTTLHTNSLTEITRRDIRRALIREGISWSGDLGETEFLSRLYNLSSVPSYDGRFENAAGEIWQHWVTKTGMTIGCLTTTGFRQCCRLRKQAEPLLGAVQKYTESFVD